MLGAMDVHFQHPHSTARNEKLEHWTSTGVAMFLKSSANGTC